MDNKSNGLKSIPLWAWVILIPIGIYGAMTFSKQVSNIQHMNSVPDFNVTAPDISREFLDNELAAIEKYKGKTIRVTGLYVTEGVSIGAPWVILSGNKDLRGLAGVQCFFPRSQLSEAAKLPKGSTITLQGTVIGKTGFVSVDNCKTVKQ